MYNRLLKYKDNGFTLIGQYKRHLPLTAFRFLVALLVVYSDFLLPVFIPSEIKFLLVGVIIGAQVQELIWIYKHHKTWCLLIDSTDWKKVESKSVKG